MRSRRVGRSARLGFFVSLLFLIHVACSFIIKITYPPRTYPPRTRNLHCHCERVRDSALSAERLHHPQHFTMSNEKAIPVAVPVAAQAQGVHVVQIDTSKGGHWKSELCGCFEDCCTCCAVLWCPCVTTAQLAVKTGLVALSCTVLASLFWLLVVASEGLRLGGMMSITCHEVSYGVYGSYTLCTGNSTMMNIASVRGSPAPRPCLNVHRPAPIMTCGACACAVFALPSRAQVLSLVFFLMSCVFVCRARAKVRQHSGIPGDDCQDCCCSFFCLSCTSCQIFRHLGIGNGPNYPTKYELCSATGENKATLLGP